MSWLKLADGHYLNLARVETAYRYADGSVSLYWPRVPGDSNATTYSPENGRLILEALDALAASFHSQEVQPWRRAAPPPS